MFPIIPKYLIANNIPCYNKTDITSLEQNFMKKKLESRDFGSLKVHERKDLSNLETAL